MYELDTSPIRPEELLEARTYALVIEWYPEDGKYLVTAPDLPGFITSGRTRAEAAELGEEAVAVWISALRQVDDPVPAPSFSNLPDYLCAKEDFALARARRSA
jgi:predicted RNase H-like HicB family nuclease